MATALTRRNFLSFDFGDRRRDSTHWVRVHRVAMSCRFEVMLASDDAVDMTAARAALDEADELEGLFTVARESSEAADLNRRAAEGPVAVSPILFDLLSRCVELHAATGGAFDVTSGAGMAHVHLDPATRSVRFAARDVDLTFGAIEKGFTLDRMGVVLRANGSARALLSAGRGTVLALGGRGRGWPVDLRPRLGSRRVGRLWLRNAAVGTSGPAETMAGVGARGSGLADDPGPGDPAHAVLGASVITKDAASADALSAAFLTGGPDLARDYCATHADTLAILALGRPAERTEVFGRCAGATLEMLAETTGC